MTAIPLASVEASQPLTAAMLQGRLGDVALPARTLALLDDSRHPSDEATPRIRAALDALVGLLVSGNADAACYEAAVARLVGLGPGLTPTGDDLLVALMATSRLLSEAGDGGDANEVLIRRAAAEALVAALAALPVLATTDVARHLLLAGAMGRFPAPLALFVKALGDGAVERPVVARLADRLVSTGAHSGADWLAGVVALVRACGAEKAL